MSPRSPLWFLSGFIFAISLAYPSLWTRDGIVAFYHQAEAVVDGQSRSFVTNEAPITCWGDSLTAGTGTRVGHDYPTLLSSVYHRKTYNEGIGGETSSQVKNRMLRRVRSSSPEAVVIWAGRNNFADPDVVEHDIKEMVVALAPGSHFLVLGVLNADLPSEWKGSQDYGTITKINRDLAEQFGKSFVPIRTILVSHANTRTDQVNIKNDVVPNSLRADHVHLNDVGQAIVAATVDAAMASNGW